jgi:hypothetical protein
LITQARQACAEGAVADCIKQIVGSGADLNTVPGGP